MYLVTYDVNLLYIISKMQVVTSIVGDDPLLLLEGEECIACVNDSTVEYHLMMKQKCETKAITFHAEI